MGDSEEGGNRPRAAVDRAYLGQFLRSQAETILACDCFTAAFDAALADAGIRTVLCNVRTPRMNAIAERWSGGCRREFLNRTLVWNQAHLRQILNEYETHHNQHRPHRSLHGAAPLKPLPEPVDFTQYRVRRHARVGGLINEIAWSHDVDKVLGTHRL
jgi:Integrase core domain